MPAVATLVKRSGSRVSIFGRVRLPPSLTVPIRKLDCQFWSCDTSRFMMEGRGKVLRTAVPILGAMVALLGLAPHGSAQIRKLPEGLCEEYNWTGGNVFSGRVVARDHVEEYLMP